MEPTRTQCLSKHSANLLCGKVCVVRPWVVGSTHCVPIPLHVFQAHSCTRPNQFMRNSTNSRSPIHALDQTGRETRPMLYCALSETCSRETRPTLYCALGETLSRETRPTLYCALSETLSRETRPTLYCALSETCSRETRPSAFLFVHSAKPIHEKLDRVSY